MSKEQYASSKSTKETKKMMLFTVGDIAYCTYHILSSDCHHCLPLSTSPWTWNISVSSLSVHFDLFVSEVSGVDKQSNFAEDKISTG